MNEAKHDELNSKLWENNELKPEVKEKLLDIVERYADNLDDIDVNLNVKDVVFVGSNANYNYSQDSDIDLHIVADLSNYSNESQDLAYKLYDAYKRLFNKDYDPTIYGCPVELYVERDEVHVNSNGMYSLYDGWIKEPKKTDIPSIDVDDLPEYKELKAKIDAFDENTSEDELSDMRDDLHVLRQESILKDGEYGVGNLIFKELRNAGCLDKIKTLKKARRNDGLSLKESIILEGIQADFKKWCQDLELANRFITERNKFPKPYNDMMFWMSKKNEKTPKDLANYLDRYVSKTEREKSDLEKGSKLVYEDDHWKVLQVLSYEAARLLGDNSTWCITGRWAGAEAEGHKYFNSYLEREYSNYFYFFNKKAKDPMRDQKYMVCTKQDELSGSIEDVDIFDQEHNPDTIRFIPDCNIKIKGLPVVGEFGVINGKLVKCNIDGDYYTDIYVPPEVTKICSGAFFNVAADCIHVPWRVKKIDKGAFEGCRAEEIILGHNDFTELDAYAFFELHNLSKIIFGKGVTQLPAYLLAYCTNLNEVVIHGTITYIDSNWLAGINDARNSWGSKMSRDPIIVRCNIEANDTLVKWCLKYGIKVADINGGEPLNESAPRPIMNLFKSRGLNPDIDYEHSTYRKATKEEALMLFNDDDEAFGNMYFNINGVLFNYVHNWLGLHVNKGWSVNKNGYSYTLNLGKFLTDVDGHPKSFVDNLAIPTIIDNADEIYYIQLKHKDWAIVDDRAENPESPNYAGSYSGLSRDLTGSRSNSLDLTNPEMLTKAKDGYTAYKRTLVNKIKTLNFMENHPEEFDADEIDDMKREISRYKEYLAKAFDIYRTYLAAARYYDSASVFKNKAMELSYLKDDVDTAVDEVRTIQNKIDNIKSGNGPKTSNAKDTLNDLEDIAYRKKREIAGIKSKLYSLQTNGQDTQRKNDLLARAERTEADLAEMNHQLDLLFKGKRKHQ